MRERIAQGRLELPAMPGVAAKAIAVLEDDNASLADAGALIAVDPLIAAEALRQANTAATGGGVKSVEAAVSRLGKLKLMRIVVEYSVRKLFESGDKRLNDDFRALWRHSLAIAIIAQGIAPSRDVAYLGGLMTNIGRVVIGNILLAAEGSMRVPADWRDRWLDTVESLHGDIRDQLLETWKLPDEIREAAKVGTDYDANGADSIANHVLCATAIADSAGYAPHEPVDNGDVLIMLGKQLLGVDDATVAGIVDELPSRLAEAGAQ